jgi:hypothetical protein
LNDDDTSFELGGYSISLKRVGSTAVIRTDLFHDSTDLDGQEGRDMLESVLLALYAQTDVLRRADIRAAFETALDAFCAHRL